MEEGKAYDLMDYEPEVTLGVALKDESGCYN